MPEDETVLSPTGAMREMQWASSE